MNISRFAFSAFALFLFSFSALSQEQIRVMQYNLLYYGTYPSFCPVSANDADKKDGYLRTIIDYVKPDVFCVNELGAGETNADRILLNVLNTGGTTKFKRALSTNNSFSDIVNMLYYNSEKLVLHSQEQVRKSLDNNNLARVIDLYKLYLNDPALAQTKDTLFITFIVAHLKAGSSSSDQEKRAAETAALIDFIDQKNQTGNFIFSGDFNVKGSSEASYQNILNTSGNVRFYDPVSQPGEWYRNSDFASIHTQSTRISGEDNDGCFASGGSDDRFDFILISEPVKNNTMRVTYKNDSYKTVGQDGNRLDKSLKVPSNNSAPAAVIDALYEMSDHYPVYLDLLKDAVLKVSNSEAKGAELIFENPVKGNLKLALKCNDCREPVAEVFTLTGQRLFKKEFIPDSDIFELTHSFTGIIAGIYILRITDFTGNIITKKLILSPH
jgi:exonuclease III